MTASHTRRDRFRPTAVVESMDCRRYCDGDNSLATATNLGTVDTYTVKNPGNLQTGSDTKDFYKFTVPAGSTKFAVKLGALGSNANLYLYNSSKTQIASSTSGGTTSEVLIQTLAPGTYYAEARLAGGNTSYSLKLANDTAGNTTASAVDTGTLFADTVESYNGYVGSLDGDDYYKFTTTANGKVTVLVNGLTADADLELLNSSGATIATADNGGTTAEQISLNLGANTYYARVRGSSFSVDAKYTLKLFGPPADVGGTTAAAKLVTTPYTGSQTIGNGDIFDYYKFNVPNSSYAVTTLTTLDSPVTLRYHGADGTVIGSDVATVGNPAELSYFLHTGGVRYVSAFRIGGLANYTIDIETPSF